MKKLLISIIMPLTTVQVFAQSEPVTDHKSDLVEHMAVDPVSEILFPILFISFLVFMLITLIKYFLEFRLKNKLIERGMSEQLTAYLSNKNNPERQNEVIKLAILFCGLGAGLTMVYLTAPVHIHSLAIMAFSLGLSYLAYFFYLRSKNT